MSKNIYKVDKIEDNNLFKSETIKERIVPAMITSSVTPNVSVPFLQRNVIIKNREESNLMLSNIVEDIFKISETVLKRPDDSGISIVKLGKSLIEEQVMPKITRKEPSNTMSVEDLMSKLYENRSKVK